MELGSEIATRWRFRGSTPSPEQWSSATWQSVLAHFMVFSRQGNSPIGLVTAFDASFQDQHCSISAAKFYSESLKSVFPAAVITFINYVFECWNFRKLYFQVPEYNMDQFRHALPDHLTEESRLRDHLYLGGRYWDQITLSVYRARWYEIKNEFSALLEANGS